MSNTNTVIYTESALLADTFQKVRDLTKWYLSLLKNSDPYQKFEVNGVALNSVAWIAAHLVWSEDFLILQCTGGKGIDLPWLQHYKINSDGSLHVEQPNIKEILDSMKLVHEKATEHLLTVNDFDSENPLGFGFGGVKTKRMLVQHAIRHEAMHTGHLSWLCKINKIETI